jgi:hypothetical protein
MTDNTRDRLVLHSFTFFTLIFFPLGISGIDLETAWNSLHLAIMSEKQPKRPNNNAKALENWESEGGAPASDDRSTKRKRPRVT